MLKGAAVLRALKAWHIRDYPDHGRFGLYWHLLLDVRVRWLQPTQCDAIERASHSSVQHYESHDRLRYIAD
jgi:hypothetical protein